MNKTKSFPKIEIKGDKLFCLNQEITSLSLSAFQEAEYFYLIVYSGSKTIARIEFSNIEQPIKYLNFIRDKNHDL